MAEEKYAESLGNKAKQIFLNICDYFKKLYQNHFISSIWWTFSERILQK